MMKKYLAQFVISIALLCVGIGGISIDTSYIAPQKSVHAQVVIPDQFRPQHAPVIKRKGEKFNERSIANIIAIIIETLLFAAGTVTIIFLIKGSSQYIIGSTGDNEAGKNTIKWSIIGLLVIVMSYLIVENVIDYVFRLQETT